MTGRSEQRQWWRKKEPQPILTETTLKGENVEYSTSLTAALCAHTHRRTHIWLYSWNQQAHKRGKIQIEGGEEEMREKEMFLLEWGHHMRKNCTRERLHTQIAECERFRAVKSDEGTKWIVRNVKVVISEKKWRKWKKNLQRNLEKKFRQGNSQTKRTLPNMDKQPVWGAGRQRGRGRGS